MSDHDYRHGGWKDKYIIFKSGGSCGGCGGRGREGQRECYFQMGGRKCRKCLGTGIDLEPCDPNAMYFVLRLDEDPNARVAALAYADNVEAVNPKFAADIRKKVAEAKAAEPAGNKGDR